MLMDRTYRPDLAESRQVRDDLVAALAPLELTDQRVNDLLLAISEAFTNVVRHGSPPPTRVSIRIRTMPGELCFEISDDGGHFDGFDAAVAAASDPSLSPLAEGGMGLGLITQLVGSLEYRRVDTENTLSFREALIASRYPTVVLVDDDPVLRKLARSYLEDLYRISDFGEATEALAAIAANPPDLIISDINMPIMDGLELRRRLQGDAVTALVPFVFLTGLRDETVEERASELEIDDFLEKPISKRRLRNAADRVLRRSRHLREMLQSSIDRRITDSLRCPMPAQAGAWRIDTLDDAASPGGGDFAMHRCGSGWTTVLLLDVMGHGVPAKIFAFAYAGYVQSLLADDRLATRPDALIDALSARIATDDRLQETIVTCAAAHLADDGTATLAVGGHPRPLLHRDGESWRPIPVSGPMPGLGGPPPQARTVQIEDGDAILLVTDGIGESLSREHPESALIDILDTVRHVDGEMLTVLDQATRSASDDRSAVLLRFNRESQP